MPTISVIIPTYGEPTYLKEAINSVLSQTLKDIELIIVDDNNPDSKSRLDTENTIGLFNDDRLIYLKHPKNLNGAAARNTGISKAKGKYISFLDSDDIYMPERLEKCFNSLEQSNKAIGGVYSGCEFRKGGKRYHIHTNVKDGNFLIPTLACSFLFCSGSNIFVRKEVIEELNGFDESFLRHQDYEFLVRFFLKYDLKAIPEVLIVKNNDNVNLPNLKKQIEIKAQYLDKFKNLINSLKVDERNYIFHSNFVIIAENALRIHKYKTAWNYYRKALSCSNFTLKEIKRALGLFILNVIR